MQKGELSSLASQASDKKPVGPVHVGAQKLRLPGQAKLGRLTKKGLNQYFS